MTRKRIVALVVLIGVAMLCVQCGDDSSSSTTLSGLFPSDLAVASPTANTSSSRGALSALRVSSSSTYSEKASAVQTLAAATAVSSCTFTPSWTTTSANANCYGPQLDYQNHPDGSPTSGQLPSGDLGIWDENESVTGGNQACAASQLNKRVENIAGQVDTAVYTLASLQCIMQANGLTPSSTATDITSQVSSAFSSNSISMTVSSATVSSTTSGSTTTTIWNMTATTTVSSSSATFTLRLKHIDNGDNTYRGKLSYTLAVSSGDQPQNCSNADSGTTGYTDATSIAYEKGSATSFTYLLHSGQFCGNDADPYVSSTNFTVDASKTLSNVSLGKGWANNFNVALFNFNPANLGGNYQFAWQAGYNDNNTRALNVAVTASRATSGCGYFGFGPKVTASSGVGSIERMICNWAGPGGAISSSDFTGETRAQRQCFTKNDTTGLFESTASTLAITYAPTNSCDGSGSLQYKKASDTSYTDGSSVTDNLISVSDVNVTTPTAPTEVDS